MLNIIFGSKLRRVKFNVLDEISEFAYEWLLKHLGTGRNIEAMSLHTLIVRGVLS